MPEVSLVAVLDADREGFLRSDTSLIQTMGRAARNARGQVILYGDRITGSMERAMAETDRRRNKQIEYNEEHGITPQTVKKAVADIMEGARRSTRRGKAAAIAERRAEYEEISPDQLGKSIAELEKKMFHHAEQLEFEEAAQIRDQITQLKERVLKTPEIKVWTD